jgi:hypothetical protein
MKGLMKIIGAILAMLGLGSLATQKISNSGKFISFA